MAKGLEREITEEQLHSLIRVADGLQNAEERVPKLDEKVDELMTIRRELQKPINGDMAPLTLQMAYEIAQEYEGIDLKFMDRAVRLQYPPRKEQLKEIGRVGARPSDKVAVTRTINYIDSYLLLVNDLRRAFPNKTFTVKEKTNINNWVRFGDMKRNIKFNSYDSNGVRIPITELKFKIYGQGYVRFFAQLYDRTFLDVCGERFFGLNEGLLRGNRPEITHHYDPEDSD